MLHNLNIRERGHFLITYFPALKTTYSCLASSNSYYCCCCWPPEGQPSLVEGSTRVRSWWCWGRGPERLSSSGPSYKLLPPDRRNVGRACAEWRWRGWTCTEDLSSSRQSTGRSRSLSCWCCLSWGWGRCTTPTDSPSAGTCSPWGSRSVTEQAELSL